MALYVNQGSSDALTKSAPLCSALPFVSAMNLTGWHKNVPLALRFWCIPTSVLLCVLLLQFLSPARRQLPTYTQQLPKQRTFESQVRRENVLLQSESLTLKSLQVILLISMAPEQTATSDLEIFLLFLERWRQSFSVIYLLILFKSKGCVLTQVHCH